MPFIIAQELLEIWKQLLGGLQQEFWHSVISNDDFACNLQAATNLTEEEYNTLLLSSGILFKRGGVTMFNKSQLDYLQAALKENIILSITRSQLQKKGKHTFFIAVGRPRYTSPSAQAKANPRLLPIRHGNGLNEESTRLLEQLCADRRAASEEPELIVEEERQDDDISMEDQHEQNEEQEHQQYEVEQQQRQQQFTQEQLDREQQRRQQFQQQQQQELENFEHSLRQDLQQEQLQFEQQEQQ